MSGMKPLRVAVVGSGPAGIYAAEALVKQAGAEIWDFLRVIARNRRGCTGWNLAAAEIAFKHRAAAAL